MNSSFQSKAKGCLKAALILCAALMFASCGGGSDVEDAAAFTVNVTGF